MQGRVGLTSFSMAQRMFQEERKIVLIHQLCIYALSLLERRKTWDALSIIEQSEQRRICDMYYYQMKMKCA